MRIDCLGLCVRAYIYELADIGLPMCSHQQLSFMELALEIEHIAPIAPFGTTSHVQSENGATMGKRQDHVDHHAIVKRVVQMGE